MVIHKDIKKHISFQRKNMWKGRAGSYVVQDMFVLKPQKNLLSQLC